MGTYLGQNFLIDAKIRHYLADKISLLYTTLGCDALIEIGPGKGSITKLIYQISPCFFVIEKDEQLMQSLECRIQNAKEIQNTEFRIQKENKDSNLKLIQGDVLDVDVEKILKESTLSPEKALIVGNLPYYITSPILRKFFDGNAQGFAGGIFMVQDEVAQKLKSDASKKSYLRWLINFAYDVVYLKGVPAKCFKPIPKVKSALIELRIKPRSSAGSNSELRIERYKFVEFLELFAPFSRKTLGAICKIIDKRFADTGALPDKMVKRPYFNIPQHLTKKRLEELDWDDIQQIL